MKIQEKAQILYILKIVFRYSPVNASIMLVQRILNALIPMLQIIFIANFINSVLKVVNNDSQISTIYPDVIAIVILLTFSMLSEKAIYFFEVKMVNSLKVKLSVPLFVKNAKLPYMYQENTKSADLIERVLKEPEIEIIEAYKNLINFMGLIISTLGIVSILISKVWWTGLIIILVCIPLFGVALKSGRANYEASRETTKLERRYKYLGEVLTGRDGIEERSLFAYGEVLNEVWKSNYEKARKLIFKTELKWFVKMKMGGLITSIISLIIIFALLPSVLSQTISIGIFISLVSATFNLVNRMTMELTQTLDNIARNIEFSKDLQKFRNMEETEEAIDKPHKNPINFDSLEFVNVSFKYPDTTKYIIKNMSFKIVKGKHYAFVGVNGAGKSTIIKLITRLYEDFEGEILINGRSILEYSLAEIKSLCAIAYQDFSQYNLTLKENIALGDVNSMENNEEKISESIKIFGLEEMVRKLPDGWDTSLGKLKKKSVDMSGGQWQRIALSRFMINPGQLRILDEPTAALDPLSESQLYEQFEKLGKGKTTIFISHRLSSTKLSDEIFVIENGCVVEKGAHQDLMQLNGLYSQLYDSQRCWYQ
ncbi:ABC transporter ATP-binding protein/permease [Paenibacillus polysaccharolyticus]|uniref:ABC transporter ATP-binding protein n=1 Tax=Paenibacillus polysaccharolyticus TaxID=582692 RepID=UPI002041EFB3|nr:ABC transporter ATP-binding protein [Paenibacillus polysaccharolyticus]MCM3135803.1 ABC transporter ATP-binding protein/permease [Paenibacillus polysaccharolyticus]